jgi:hypothetical protein
MRRQHHPNEADRLEELDLDDERSIARRARLPPDTGLD